MSSIEVIGGISAVIAIVDASIKIYKNAKKDIELSEKFKAVGRQLPIIHDTLQTCKTHLEPSKDSIPADDCNALEEIIYACEEKAEKLKKIFDKVIPGESGTWEKRYTKIIQRLGKGSEVEQLMISIAQDVQHIVNNRVVKSIKPEQNAELENIIQEMEALRFSEEGDSGNTFNSKGPMTNNFLRDNAQQITNNARIGTQKITSVVYKQKENFSFRKPVGACLGQAPHIGPELFVGRNPELDQMKRILEPEDNPREQRRLVLGGAGGMGKTQLAIAYAKRYRTLYTSIFWLNTATETTLKDSFRLIAKTIFDIQDPDILEPDQTIIHICRWLSDTENTQWLLIFDNYDDPNQFKIEQYYPLASHGAIIVTTRRPDLVSGKTVQIQPLKDIRDSLIILQTRSQRQNTTSDSHAKRLAERLDGLPLALATAGVYLRYSSFTFERYLQEYEKRWNIDSCRPPTLEEYQNRTLYTTWDLSYAALGREDLDAAKLLKLLAYFDNQNIWRELLCAGLTDNTPSWLRGVLDDVAFDGAMGTLAKYCFLEAQTGDAQTQLGLWSMHSCVHDWTLATLNKDIDAEQYWYTFDCVAEAIGSVDDFETLNHLSHARLAAHATRLVHQRFLQNDLIDNIAIGRFKGAVKIAVLLREQVQLVAAEHVNQRVLRGYQKAFGANHTSTLNIKQGKLVKAEDIYQRALQGYQKALGADYISILNMVNNLGNLYQKQGKLAKAEDMYQRALKGKEKVLGNLYQKQGRLAKAEDMYQRALQGKEKVLGADHISTLNTVNHLGNLYQKQGRLAKAEDIYQRALQGYQKALGQEQVKTFVPALDIHGNLGLLYKRQGRKDDAKVAYLVVLQGIGTVFGTSDKRYQKVTALLSALGS
ncbi:kinesin light chain [Nannizzia gypsea CBS 118893]|uniref:Kinesin light chain n=1 Tax=Arthroderma gypseum (strain ATCC MYA-4604 / CBS 118893) TaxID=535722 RepID=E4V4K2_ARTGP|nr:kinesin light chain [Nannizzia gypsea CBS 118893]EFR04926.1 kinesin light chain [Nannizzia gypsea CBS 118893]